MKPIWKQYWRETLGYLRYLALGLTLSLFPFLLNLKEYVQARMVVKGFFISIGFGLIIGGVIWSLLALFYAAKVFIHIRTGQSIDVSPYAFLLLVCLVALCGISAALFLMGFFLSRKTSAEGLFYTLTLTSIFGVVFYFYHSYNKAKERALASEAALSQARYQTLEHQMRPHFLFNALNSLAELIESKEETAAEMTYKLSDLYRQILQNSKTKTSSLDSEVEIARRYLELEQLRFGPRLSFSFDAPNETDEIFLPSLMLQTLVENAIKHGVAKSIEGGNVFVEIKRTKNGLYCLSVTNTGEGFKQTSIAGNGLRNTRERLELLYGNRHEFSIGPGANGETRASFFFTGEKID
jgi:sensor histidine kinase YesM